MPVISIYLPQDILTQLGKEANKSGCVAKALQEYWGNNLNEEQIRHRLKEIEIEEEAQKKKEALNHG